MNHYIPQPGDFVSISLDPQSGHEQKGRRPALVLSNSLFNGKTGLAFVCPITNTNRGNPFHLPIPSNNSVTGVAMVDQIKSVDYASRNVTFIDAAPVGLLEDILSLLGSIVEQRL